MAGERILIIDDSEQIISFLVAVLQPLGYMVSYTGDGKDGLARAVYEKPDLVLLDLNLPGMSGIAVLEALHQRAAEVPVIMMTFHGSESVVSRAMRLGVRDYLTKPFQVEDILSSIERVLREEREKRAQDIFTIDPTLLELQVQPAIDGAAFHALVGTALVAVTSRHAFLTQTTEAALRLSGADVSAVFLIEGGAPLAMAALRQGEVCRVDVSISDHQAEVVLRSGKPLQVSASADPSAFTAQLGIPARTLVYVPVRLRERGIGVIAVAFRQPGQEPSVEVVDWLLLLSDYVALLWENVRFRDILQRSLPLQKVGEVLGVFSRHILALVQTLSQRAGGGEPTYEAKALAAFLAVLKDVASPKSALYISKAQAADIEKELDSKLKRL
ncbi:MAG TPA: response regulator [Anaerolineae bacterium]|nr:response regulator [Anaerolineae bacterium]HQI84122.1 response regulator [Anaerolineae bacterium]